MTATPRSGSRPSRPRAEPVPLAAKVAFLSRPGSYAERPASVQVVETHMACVFLTDRHAFKLKKPVRYPFLDYRSLEERRRVCEEEVRLNRRLAPDVYLGTLPLTREPGGDLALGGEGEVVDWLVEMRRLPRDRMLDVLIRRGRIAEEDVREVGERLGRFYAGAPPVPTSPEEYRARLRERIREDRRALAAPEFGLDADRLHRIAGGLSGFVERRAAPLDRRVEEGRIVEGHGDLRPEHICLEPEPVVIDCIEFRRDYRILDPVDELAFLDLECDRLGARWIGERILEIYGRIADDRPSPAVVAFHRACRALLRAKLAVFHLRDEGVDDRSRWLESADWYLEAAAADLPRLDPPATSGA